MLAAAWHAKVAKNWEQRPDGILIVACLAFLSVVFVVYLICIFAVGNPVIAADVDAARSFVA